MDSRERTFLTLEHQEPDRVPIDCWLSSGMEKKIKRNLHISKEQFLEKYDVDLRYIEGPLYIGKQQKINQGSSEIDLWGVPRCEIKIKLDNTSDENIESYKEVLQSPLKEFQSVEDVMNYKYWPSADLFDYRGIEGQCDSILNSRRVVVFMGDRLNRIAQLKPATYLRGYEQILIDMLINPEIAKAIIQKISSFYMEYESRILEAGKGKIDILCTGDDFGSQKGMLISPLLWNNFLKKGFRDFNNLGRSYGAKIMHHTCGSVYPIIPEMIKCNLDILQSIQPEAYDMDPKVLKIEFGESLSFQGGISIQKVLPHGSTTEVKEHVRSLFETMAPDGGYIACTSHNIQADTAVANVEALFQAYHEYGKYK